VAVIHTDKQVLSRVLIS